MVEEITLIDTMTGPLIWPNEMRKSMINNNYGVLKEKQRPLQKQRCMEVKMAQRRFFCCKCLAGKSHRFTRSTAVTREDFISVKRAFPLEFERCLVSLSALHASSVDTDLSETEAIAYCYIHHDHGNK